MALPNPIDNPAAHDVFKLDKLFSPFSKITECNGQTRIFQEQQAPGFLGAFLVERGEHLISITYQIEIISRTGVAGFGTLDPLLAYCKSIHKRRPAVTAKLVDLRLAPIGAVGVALERLPYQQQLDNGKWGYVFKFIQNKRMRIAGGPVASTRFDSQMEKLQDQLKGETANADAALAAARAARGEQGKRNRHVGGP